MLTLYQLFALLLYYYSWVPEEKLTHTHTHSSWASQRQQTSLRVTSCCCLHRFRNSTNNRQSPIHANDTNNYLSLFEVRTIHHPILDYYRHTLSIIANARIWIKVPIYQEYTSIEFICVRWMQFAETKALD